MSKFQLGFGSNKLEIALPDKQIINVVEGKPVEPIKDPRLALHEVIYHPVGSSPFSEIFKPGDKVAIVVSDLTRVWLHYNKWLPPLLDELNQLGVPDSDITVVVALGAHRRHTSSEHVRTYGTETVNRVEIVQSYAPIRDDFTYVGRTSRGVEVALNKYVLATDKVILTGGIVYHDMAGFGGGPKAILPGISGYETIQQNHRHCLHAISGRGLNPNCTRGKLTGNPMHEDLAEIAEMLNPAFLINVVMTPDGELAQFFAGHWRKAWKAGCEKVTEVYGVPITAKADLVIASSGGYPRDINMYQGSKTVANAFSACKDDGVLILFMECREISEPPDFSQWFEYDTTYALEMKLRQEFTVPGFTALKIRTRAAMIPHIVVTLPQNKKRIEKMGMRSVSTAEEALELAERLLGRKEFTISVMSQAANTVPLEG